MAENARRSCRGKNHGEEEATRSGREVKEREGHRQMDGHGSMRRMRRKRVGKEMEKIFSSPLRAHARAGKGRKE